MKVIDQAKQGQSKPVIEAVKNGSAKKLQVLLQKVCQDYHSIRKHEGHLDLVRYLLSAGAKPEREMVCEAARGGHELLIHALIECGLPVDIFVAAALGQAEEVKSHIDGVNSVTQTDLQGLTPLHYCCASSIWRIKSNASPLLETCSTLLSTGADVHATGSYHGLDGITPLFYVAWTGGHPGIAKKLLDHRAGIT